MHPLVRASVPPELRARYHQRTGVDPAWALDYFARFFHEPLSRHLDITRATALECASGCGYNALAYLILGGRAVVGCDITVERLAFARDLAADLGLARRARFVRADIHSLPAAGADVVLSLQTLEHVPEPHLALRRLGAIAGQAMVLSTPNRLFPRDGHDTGLLFAHWLPPPARRAYARLRGAPTAQLCTFLGPGEIEEALPGFHRATSAYCFASLAEWLARFPCFFPYGPGGGRWLPARRHGRRWRAACLAFDVLGASRASRLLPVSEGIWLRG